MLLLLACVYIGYGVVISVCISRTYPMPFSPIFQEFVSVIVGLFLLQIVDFVIVESVLLVISVFHCAVLSRSVSIHPGKLPFETLEISSTNDMACWQVPMP